jgi:hypothetical protein
MKKPALVLLALLSVLPFAQSMAQTLPVPAPAPDAAQFLATLSDGQNLSSGDLTPAPSFMASCTSGAQCPTGQLCCWVCGNPPLSGGTCKACVTPIKGRCPLVV